MIVVFVLFLTVSSFPLRLVFLALLGMLNAGWYAIPQARLYATLPGRPGTAVAFASIGGFGGSLIAALVGGVAALAGISVAMWLLVVGPVVFLLWLPHPADRAVTASSP